MENNIFKKILFIMEKKDKVSLVFIFLLMIVSALLDLIGVSAILPIVSLLTTPNEQFNPETANTIIRIIYHITGITDKSTLALITLLLLAGFFIIKTLFAFFNTYAISKFTMNFSRRLTKKQMDTYLAMPYEFHLNNNSSTLIRKCTYDVGSFTGAVSQILNAIVKLITMISLVVYLFLTDWMVTLIIGGAMAIFSIIIIFILKPHIRKIAKKNQQLNSNNYKYLSQSFNGIKESKISNTEKYFVDMYDNNIKAINSLSLRNTIYGSVPSHALELVGMLGLIGSLIAVVASGVKNTAIIETFAVFAYAVIKLLPCVTYLNNSINNMNWYKVSIDSIYNDLIESNTLGFEKEIITDKFVDMPFKKDILIQNVTFAYSSVPNKKILDNVSCVIKKNTSVAFSGVSGAGKTTMIDIILGLLKPQSGSICCDGEDINENIRGWRNNLSYIPQTIYLMDDTIRNNIIFGKKEGVTDEQVWDALEKAQLREFVQELPEGLDTVIGERGVRLSGGQRQRIGIARAFFKNTNIIVFDEATSALDYETEKNILDHVNKYAEDHTLIIITHRLNTIENCDAIYKVENGSLTQIK